MRVSYMAEKKHICYFDYIRVFAALCVVYMHVASGPLRGALNRDWHFINLFTCAGFTAVPLFFMMSGYLLLSGKKSMNIDVLLKKRLPRLLVPLCAWTVVALLWKAWQAHSLSGFRSGLVAALSTPAWTHFWYMYTLIALYVLSPILCGGLQSLDPKGRVFVLILALLPTVQAILRLLLPDKLTALVNLDIIDKVTVYGGHLSTFVLGYYLGSMKKRIPNGWLLLAAGVLLGTITFGTYRLTVQAGQFIQSFQNQACGFEILLAAVVFLMFKQNADRESRFLKRVPIVPLSLAIYLMHGILLSMLGSFLTVSSFFDTVCVTLLTFALCFAATKTAATVKPLCYPVTGLSYRNACESCNWVYTWRKIKDRRAAKRIGK